ncbi:hypothetical protein PG990_010487 [Apiospora arundinis]
MDSIEENPFQSTPDRQMPDEVIDLTMVEDDDSTSNVKQEDGISQTGHRSPATKVKKENDVIDITMIEDCDVTSSVKQEDDTSRMGHKSPTSGGKDDEERLFVPEHVSPEPDQARMKREFSTAQEVDNVINSIEELKNRRSREVTGNSHHENENLDAPILSDNGDDEQTQPQNGLNLSSSEPPRQDSECQKDELRAALANKQCTPIELGRLKRLEQRVQDIEAELQSLRSNTLAQNFTQEEHSDNDSIEEPVAASRTHRGMARTAKEWFERHLEPKKESIARKRKILHQEPSELHESIRKRQKTNEHSSASDPSLRRLFSSHTSNKIHEARLAGQQFPEAEELNAPTRTQQAKQSRADALKRCKDPKVVAYDMNRLTHATKSFGLGNCVADSGNWASTKWKLTGVESHLYNHQVIGASWMLGREFGEDRGGILADEMGLGKTVQTLACIAYNRPQENDPKPTLIVVPSSAIPQWLSEIKKHLPRRSFTHTQFKASKGEDQGFLENTDIIFSEVSGSYLPIKARQEMKSKDCTDERKQELIDKHLGMLFHMRFWRVVLDEAHAIKNHQSQTSVACRNLKAEHRWALSGTPLQNSPEELWPYLAYLNVSWAGKMHGFRKMLENLDHPANTKKLETIIRETVIRRTMDDTILGQQLWKAKTFHVEKKWIDHTEEEKIIYRCVEGRFREILTFLLRKLRREGKVAKMTDLTFYLVYLLRLRQATAHPFLLEPAIKKTLREEDIRGMQAQFTDLGQRKPVFQQIRAFHSEAGSGQNGFGSSQFGYELDMDAQLDMALAAKDDSVCKFCLADPEEPQENKCGHLFCKACIENAILQAQGAGEPRPSCSICEKVLRDWKPVDSPEKASSPGAEQDGHSQAELDAFATLKTTPEKFAAFIRHEEQKQRLGDRQIVVKTGKDGRKLGDDYLNVQPRQKNSRTAFLKALDKDYPQKPMAPSAKTTQVKHTVLKWQKKAPDDKIIIFTQFLQEGQILGRMLQAEEYPFVYFFGEMSAKEKEAAIETFAQEKKVKVMIASLKCGGVALNLTCANRVILVDPWWNASIENQAFGRVYRIGQTKETFLQCILVKGTIDQRIHDLQEKKMREIEQAMHYSKGLSVDEIISLFGNLTEDEDGNPILEADYNA